MIECVKVHINDIREFQRQHQNFLRDYDMKNQSTNH